MARPWSSLAFRQPAPGLVLVPELAPLEAPPGREWAAPVALASGGRVSEQVLGQALSVLKQECVLELRLRSAALGSAWAWWPVVPAQTASFSWTLLRPGPVTGQARQFPPGRLALAQVRSPLELVPGLALVVVVSLA